MNEILPPRDSAILIRDLIRGFLPKSVFLECPDALLRSPHSFFLREGENFFWLEAVRELFTRESLPDYLAKARRVQAIFPAGVTGILLAPQFEAGVPELFEWMRFSVRLFRYKACETPEPGFHIEECRPNPHSSDTASAGTSTTWNRLTREELREFIDLELDLLK